MLRMNPINGRASSLIYLRARFSSISRLFAPAFFPLNHAGVCGKTTVGVGDAVAAADGIINLDAGGVFIDAAFINARFPAAGGQRAD